MAASHCTSVRLSVDTVVRSSQEGINLREVLEIFTWAPAKLREDVKRQLLAAQEGGPYKAAPTVRQKATPPKVKKATPPTVRKGV